MNNDLSVRPALGLDFAQISDVGGRTSNQDAVASAQQDGLACFVVSDGAGGHIGGEVASNIVVKTVIDSFLRELSFGVRALQSYVGQAIVRVAQGKVEERLADMSATVATVLIDQKNRYALWAHLGDTRVYLFRERTLHSMTKDHSLIQQFIDAGYSRPDQARTHPQRNVLFAAIGTEGDTSPAVTPDVIEIEDGDAFLICTDGFWEWITEDEMERTLATATDADDWLAGMCRIAATNSSASAKLRDNYSAQTLWVRERETQQPAVATISNTAP